MNECKFCKKSFKSEKTLVAHMCVKKRRNADKDTVGSRLGFRVFQRFYELYTNSKKPKTFDEFIHSKFYMDFVKFGRHIVAINPIDADKFVDYVLKNGIKMRDWTKDSTYETFLEEFVKKEPAQRATERTIIEMESWASENSNSFNNYFSEVGTIEAVYMIRSGRISPWVLYLSESSEKLMSSMTSEQLKMIERTADPDKWASIFENHMGDVRFVKSILKQAGV